MMGPWEVISNPIGGAAAYIVCRVKNEDEPVHSGNLRYADRGYTKSEEEADGYAQQLNDLEESLPRCKKCGTMAQIVFVGPNLVTIRCCQGITCTEVSGDTLQSAIESWKAEAK